MQVPQEVRALVSDFIPTQDLGQENTYIDEHILERFRERGINPLAILRQKEYELSEIERIKSEGLVPTILAHTCNGSELTLNDRGLLLFGINDSEEFISKMKLLGWVVTEGEDETFDLIPSSHKCYTKLMNDLRKWDTYVSPLYDITGVDFN